MGYRSTSLSANRGDRGIGTLAYARYGPIPRKTHVWRRIRITPEWTPEQMAAYASMNTCCMKDCGKISHYKVSIRGYCADHRSEAYADQAIHWASRVRYYEKGLNSKALNGVF